MRLALATLIAVARAQNRKCLTCQASFDHTGAELPFNDPNCFDEESINPDYSRECSNPEDICLLQVDVRWSQGGSHEVSVIRSCGQADQVIPNGCLGNYETFPLPMTLYKVCNAMCDSNDDCNGIDLYEEVMDLHSNNNEITCHTCSYENNNGVVLGQIECANGGSSIKTQECPRYANAACFTAAMWSDDIKDGKEVTFEEDHRGCSGFNFNTLDSDCQSGQNGATGHFAECKSTCNDDTCNTSPLSKRKSCISCSGTRLSDNSTVGVGDDSCWGDNMQGSPNSVQCESEDDVCVTEIEVDWLPKGAQQATIKRGCAAVDSRPAQPCLMQVVDVEGVNFQYKDCQVDCDFSNCNTGLDEVAALFSSANPQDSCYACRYHQLNNGQVEGKPECLDDPVTEVECPMYADAGCYTSSAVHFIEGEIREDVYRGCSTFDQAATPTECSLVVLPDDDGSVYNFGVCKEFCEGKSNCNGDEHNQPDLPVDGIWSACQTCNVVVDQLNNTVGVGDADCLDGDVSLVKICPNELDRCMVEMEVDWYPRGHHTYRVKRGCSPNVAQKNCASGATSLIQYVDCQIDCDPHIQGNGCNSGLDVISDKLYDPMGVTSCYYCNFTENTDGSVEGQPTCGNEVMVGGAIKSLSCPKYATTSCYHAASFHVDYVNEGEFADDFRGCSPFEENRQQYCESTIFEGISHLNCRDTCDTNNCNTEKIQKRPQCYSCQAIRDSQGNPVGVGDDNCFDNLNEGLLTDCETDYDYCIDEMLVDWLVKGEQVVQLRRGCSKTAAPQTCAEAETDNIKYKDCLLSCNGNACNDDLTVGDKFIGSYKEKSCYSCKYVELDNGDVSGNTNCIKSGGDFMMDCPNYMSAACYTGASVHFTSGQRVDEVYKGCSSFETNGGTGGTEDHQVTTDEDIAYVITKTSCRGANCNPDHISPLDPEEPAPIEGNPCLVCSVTVDQFNRTVGIGQDSCWDGNNQYLMDCGEGSFCMTEMEIDWFAKGNFNYRLLRGCSAVEAPACYGGGSTLIQYKDCSASCDPAKDGPGCNTGLIEVGEKFSSQTVSSCYQCEYVQGQDGTVSGMPTCGDEIINSAIPTYQCPLYADSACYWAASFHQDFTNTGLEMEDDHRGCSPFVLERENQCEQRELDGIDHINCKHTCVTEECNNDKVVKTLQCHSCTAVQDSEGKSVGLGDDRCFDYAGDTPMVDCQIGFEACSTELLVDWYARGQQQTTIRRGCAEAPTTQPCEFASSDRIKYKDCFENCPGYACNTGLTVGDKFNEGYTQEMCYACSYSEEDDGTVSGNSNCPDTPTDNMITQCKNWQTNGCYIGTAVHEVEGERREEVYKGCSSFYMGEITEYHNDTLENDIVYSLAKQSCRGELCNINHDIPDDPEAQFRCMVCSISKDHLGNTFGTADEYCWDDPQSYMLSACNPGSVCITEMLVDWYPKGEQVVSLDRKCGVAPTTPDAPKCLQNDFSTYMWKDCWDYCEEYGCNTEFDVVADLFDQGNDIDCYSCKYGVDLDGTILLGSNDKCGLSDVTGEISSMTCPKYANAACYTASTWHSMESFQEDYKGCSTFRLEENEHYCENFETNGEALSACKETCDSNNCNNMASGSNECLVCQVTVDQFNQTVGVGQTGCWYGEKQYIQDCGVNSMCKTEMEIDWFSKGQFNYRLIRGCLSENMQAPVDCYEGSSSMIQYKDCSVSCDPQEEGPGCNDGLTEVGEKFSSKTVSHCYQCEYVQLDDGTVSGMPQCGNEIVEGANTIPTYQCPLYADSACYWAASFHLDLMGSDAEFEDDHRGCSPFQLEREDECVTGEIGGIGYINCRDTCQDDHCNTGRHVKTFQCHVCSAVQDSEGNQVGIGDSRCFNSAESTPLTDCPIGFEACSTELLVDWYARGQQQTTIRRGCVEAPTTRPCDFSSSDRAMYKDCFENCGEYGCNTGLTVGEKFNEGYDQESCYSCSYVEEDNGEVLGNINCPDFPQDNFPNAPSSSTKNTARDCPNWATNGCYTGTAVHDIGGATGRREEVYKGCSAFWIGESTQLHNDTQNGVEFSLAKQTCRGENCNLGTDRPDNPDPEFLCHSCRIQKDFLGNTIGGGDESCWDEPLARTLAQCSEGNVCITEMLVDWYPKGEQMVTLERKCGPRPTSAGGNKCVQNDFSTYMWKDCQDYCETAACNNEFDIVADLFDQGNEIDCYSCKYARDVDGSILDGSNERCGLPDVTGEIATLTCPKYANAACYSASTWHSYNDEDIEEDYKGCSTFHLIDEQHYCEDFSINGEAYTSCKETCDGSNCNSHTDGINLLSCYTCDVTFDSNNQTVGYGHPSCFGNNPDPADIQACSDAEQYCVVEIETDWLFLGDQTTRVRRGCSEFAAPDNCFSSSTSDTMFLIKDCASSCEESNCNKDMNEAAAKFSSASPTSECYTCNYIEMDNGDLGGNKFCGEEPEKVPDASVACPMYANAGCYTGTNAHYTDAGVNNEGIFKGCSSFEIPELSCNTFENSETGGDAKDWGICKVTCSEENCNMDHNRPCVPTAGDDCGYTGGDIPITGSASSIILSLFTLLPLLFIF